MNSLKIWSIFLILNLFTSSCSTSKRQGQSLKSKAEHTIQPLSTRIQAIQLVDLSNKIVRIEDHLDRPIFLNFWATWCGPCRAEMPDLAFLAEKYKGKVHFFAASDEDVATINRFISAHDYPFHFLKLKEKFIDAYVVSLPTSILIGKDGSVLFEEEGFRDWTSQHYIDYIETLIRSNE